MIEMEHNSSSRTAGDRDVERKDLDEKRWLAEASGPRDPESKNRCNALSEAGMCTAQGRQSRVSGWCATRMESSWLGRAASAATTALIAGLVRRVKTATSRVMASPNMADPPPQRFSLRHWRSRPRRWAHRRRRQWRTASCMDGLAEERKGTRGMRIDLTRHTPAPRRRRGSFESFAAWQTSPDAHDPEPSLCGIGLNTKV